MTAKKKPATARIEIVYRSVKDLKTDPKNANKHPPEQIAQLRAGYKKHGIYGAILLDETDTVRVGNGRLEAWMAEGVEEVPTITRRGLSPRQWTELAITDNRVARNSEWNSDQLRADLTALGGAGVDLGAMGFAPLELSKLAIPGFDPKTITMPAAGDAKFEVIITCKTEKEQEKLLARLLKEGLSCRALLG